MRIFLVALCMTSLLFSGVGMARVNGEVVAKSSGKAAQLLGKKSGLLATIVMAGLGLGFACGITGCGEDDEVAEAVDETTETAMETFKIGLTYYSGLEGSLEGAQLAVQQLNEGGGINGRTVELLARDNQRNTDVSLSTVKELIENDQVYAITGPDYSTQASAFNGYAQGSMTPVVTAGATNPNVGAIGDFIFQASFVDSFQGEVMAQLAVDEHGANTAAVFYLDGDVYSEGLNDAFTKSFAALGGEVVATIGFPLLTEEGGHEEFVATLKAGLGAVVEAQPDVLFIPSFTFGSREAAKLAREAGVNSHLLGADGWSFDGPIIGDNGEYAEVFEGALFSDHFNPDAVEGVTPQGRQFVIDYTAANGKKPNTVAAVNYDAIWVVGLAAQAIDPNLIELVDIRRALRDSIAATNGYHGATSILSFNEFGHPRKSVVINGVEGGDIYVFKVVNPKPN